MNESHEKQGLTRKDENFSEWYNEVIERTALSDKRYPIKGLNVWPPYGWKIMRLIDEIFRREFDATNHAEVCFPLLIPEDQFQKEAEHIKGFSEEVFWVTHAGKNPLDTKLLLRPTSETAMYPVFTLWVRSHTDLPLKTYQIVNTFRYETKQTRAFIRVREIHFFEAHTCHADFEDAERQIAEDIDIWDRIAKTLCLPYLLCRRPDWDKFAGADYSLSADTFVAGRTLQIGTIHQYRDNFSRAFGIKYEDIDGKQRYVHQTTFGMSERLVGALIGVHGDDYGLVLPPAVAPIQVVIVPIFTKDTKEKLLVACNELQAKLQSHGFRCKVDDRELRPGNKYYYWELRGVPLRIEFGPKELKDATLTWCRRDTKEKCTRAAKNAVEDCQMLLSQLEKSLHERAKKLMEKNIRDAENLEVAKQHDGILRLGWCGSEECGHKIEEELEVAILGTPVAKERYEGKCVVCDKTTDVAVYCAKTF